MHSDNDLNMTGKTRRCRGPETTSSAWRQRCESRKASDILKALEAHRRLEAASSFLKLVGSDLEVMNASKDISKAATQISQHVADLKVFFSEMVATSLFNEHRQDGAAAKKVFAIPELLERILQHFETTVLLLMQQVNRNVRDMIDQSMILRRLLHIEPNLDGYLQTPFDRTRIRPLSCKRKCCSCKTRDREPVFPGFQCWSRTRSAPSTTEEPDAEHCKTKTILAELTAGRNGEFPTIGSRCRKMLICQPVVIEMTVYASCCERRTCQQEFMTEFNWAYDFQPAIRERTVEMFLPSPPDLTAGRDLPPRREIMTVESSTGLTVGHLYEAALKVQKAHRLCPYAPTYQHDVNGYVKPNVLFACNVKLKDDDPVLAPEGRTKPMVTDELSPFVLLPTATLPPILPDNHESTIQAYIEEKRRAAVGGEPIPTLEEFKSMPIQDPFPVQYPGPFAIPYPDPFAMPVPDPFARLGRSVHTTPAEDDDREQSSEFDFEAVLQNTSISNDIIEADMGLVVE